MASPRYIIPNHVRALLICEAFLLNLVQVAKQIPPIIIPVAPPSHFHARASATRRSRQLAHMMDSIESDEESESDEELSIVSRRRARSGVSVYSTIRSSPRDWWHLLRMSYEDFDRIKSLFLQHPEMRQHPHYQRNINDRLCLTLLWLAQYDQEETFAIHFGLHQSTVYRTITEFIPLLLGHFCMDLADRNTHPHLRGQCPEFPRSLGIIDVSHTPVEKPKGKNTQSLYFRGDLHNHSVSTQLIIDFHGKPIHVSTAYPGSAHDLRIFKESNVMSLLGPGDVLLADNGYERGPFIIPFERATVTTPVQSYFNKRLSHYRVRVEQTFRYMKRFQSFAGRWRHKRALLSPTIKCVASICAMQLNRFPLYE